MESGYNEGLGGGGKNSLYADIPYRHEACSVCHQGALPLQSALLPTCCQNALLIIHVQVCVTTRLSPFARPLQIMYCSDRGVASRIGLGGGRFLATPKPHLDALLSDPLPFDQVVIRLSVTVLSYPVLIGQ